jgi:hypothetical protein
MTRADWLLLLIVLGTLPLLYARFWHAGGPANWLEVQAGNAPPQVISLSTGRQLDIAGPLGNSRIEVHDGKARFLDSPCHGKLCVQAGWLEHAGETVACLPNRVTIQLLGRHPKFDAVNF